MRKRQNKQKMRGKNEEPQLSTKYNLPRTIKDLKDLKDY